MVSAIVRSDLELGFVKVEYECHLRITEVYFEQIMNPKIWLGCIKIVSVCN